MKKTYFAIFLFSIIYNTSYSQTPFNQPWLNNNSLIIIDAYAGNDINWDSLKQDKRVVAVIHKATEGNSIDSKFKERKIKATENGYLFGAYHLGRSGDASAQADFFLHSIGNYNNTLLALDLEAIGDKYMTLENAEIFIKRIFEKTGRYPFVYCNKDVLNQINEKYDQNSLFSKCKLWYARFRKDIPSFDQKIWPSYTLWQFSSEINCSKTGECLYNVPGTRYDMDVNVFYGNLDSLKAVWTGR